MESDLQKQIRDLQKRVADRTFNRNRNRSRTRSEQVYRDANVFYRFWVQIVIAAFWVWHKVLWPISNLFWKVALFLFDIYKQLWSLFVYKRNEYGDLVFSKVRAGIFLLISLPVILAAGSVAVDGTVFAFTFKQQEQVYLFNSNDNSFKDKEEFSVTGCEIREVDPTVGFECDSGDTVYFRVNPTWIEYFYAVFVKQDLFYAENIASTIAPGWNVCKVDSWYFRFKLLYRNTQIYPKLLDASCRPLTMSN